MDGNAAQIIAATLAFAGVQAGAYIEAKVLQALPDRLRALNRPGRAGERQNETIPRRVDRLTIEIPDLAPDGGIVHFQ